LISSQHEGRTYPPYRIRIERPVGQDYWRAMGMAGEPDSVPLTYFIFLRGETRGVDLFRDLDIPRKQALHGGQRYEWFEPLHWNDELDVVASVERVTSKQSKGGPLWFADVVYDYHQVATGRLAVRETTRLIKRGMS
jgi:hypothetical protein